MALTGILDVLLIIFHKKATAKRELPKKDHLTTKWLLVLKTIRQSLFKKHDENYPLSPCW